MSRRLLMAGGGGGSPAATPTDPPDTGPNPEPPDSVWAGWATTSDPLLMEFRPGGRRTGLATLNIPNATHTDHNQAATDAKFDARAIVGNVGYWDGIGPQYRHDILFGPGTYNGGMGGGDWGCYVGTTGNPADATLQTDGGSGGTIHSFGSLYLEALTIRAYSSDGDLSPKYPWHITGGPVTVAANCVFDTRGAISGVPTGPGDRTAGLVGKDSSVLTAFYNCTFKATPGTADGFNMHGEATPRDLPETALFINCTTEGVASIGSTGNVSNTGEKARLYVIGLTHDEHLTEITADSNTEVYTDSELPVNGASAVFRGVTTWPELIDGMLPEQHAYYYPSALADPPPVDKTIAVIDAAPMAPVPGRTYFTRIRLDEALCAKASGFICTTAAGEFGITFVPADTPYVRDEPVNRSLLNPDTTFGVGTVVKQHYYAYTRYPGDNGLWVKVAFDNAAARVMGSASLPGLTDCAYSDDGTTLVPVSAGTPHPITFLRGN